MPEEIRDDEITVGVKSGFLGMKTTITRYYTMRSVVAQILMAVAVLSSWVGFSAGVLVFVLYIVGGLPCH